MTTFDLIVMGIIGISAILAFVHGFVRVVGSLLAWVVALLLAVKFSGTLGAMLPEIGNAPALRYIAAFALILVTVLIGGALIGLLLSKLVHAAGLGFIDRMLGALVGIARGMVIVVLLVLLAGLTALPQQAWWQEAVLGPPLTVAALSLRTWLPKPWAERLDYGVEKRRTPKASASTRAKAPTRSIMTNSRVAPSMPGVTNARRALSDSVILGSKLCAA